MKLKSDCKKISNVAETNPGDISDLPDEILCHILSLLHPKDAVKTSILSSRWKDVYKGVPNIKLSIERICEIAELDKRINFLEARVGEVDMKIKMARKYKKPKMRMIKDL